MPWVLLEFIWRRKYHANLFGGLLKTLREVEFNRREFNPPVYTQIIQEVGDRNSIENTEEIEVTEEETEEDTEEDTEEYTDEYTEEEEPPLVRRRLRRRLN